MNSMSRNDADIARALQAGLGGGVRDDRILPEVRWTAVVVIVVLLTTVGVLYGFPERTGELFAWKIDPPMSALFLGAGYAGGLYFFVRVALASRWHTVANIFTPTTVFVWLMLAATLLHFDRFIKDSVAFNLWIVIYLITPIYVPFLWYRNRVTDPHVVEPGDIVVPRSVRVASGMLGVGALVFAVILFALPQFGSGALDIWPWKLTPLTARVTAAAMSFPAVAWVMLGREQRWSGWRVPLGVQLVALGMTLLAVPRAWDSFDGSRLATWVFVGVLLALVAATLVLYVTMEARRRAAVVAPKQIVFR
ncbi:MAG: hypothetical protein WCD37_06960 [Chloroflexia bacterium]